MTGDALPLLDLAGGRPGSYDPRLVASWDAAGVGGACGRCGETLEGGGLRWCGPGCPACEREYMVEARGCRCGGLNLCPDCQAAGATEATRGEVRCDPCCSTLCPACCPDD